jgi:hypothetical protein
MRYTSHTDGNVMRRASLGPAAMAARQVRGISRAFGDLHYKPAPIPQKQFQDWRLGVIDKSWRFGAVNSQLVSAGGAAGGAIAGATAGSVVPVVGTAIGMVVGAVVGILTQTSNTASHIGTWDTQLAQGIQSLPASASGIGRQIPWNENSHGLVQMIEALLATGVYMAWDASLKSNYNVCAHWSTTFATAVQSVVQAIVAGQSSATIVLNTAASGIPNKVFNFINPGISVGPDVIAAQTIMGASGLMYWMITAIGETTTHASSNASNALAQKVYALMVDNVAAQLVPAVPATPVPVVAPIVTAAAAAANNAVASGQSPTAAVTVPAAQATIIPVAGTQAPIPNTGSVTTVLSPAVGYPAAAPAPAPIVTAAVTTSGIPSWVWIAGAAALVFILMGNKSAPAPAAAA